MCDDSFQEGNFLAEFEDELADDPIFTAKPSENEPLQDQDQLLADLKKNQSVDNTPSEKVKDQNTQQLPLQEGNEHAESGGENKNGQQPTLNSDQQVKTQANTYHGEN